MHEICRRMMHVILQGIQYFSVFFKKKSFFLRDSPKGRCFSMLPKKIFSFYVFLILVFFKMRKNRGSFSDNLCIS